MCCWEGLGGLGTDQVSAGQGRVGIRTCAFMKALRPSCTSTSQYFCTGHPLGLQDVECLCPAPAACITYHDLHPFRFMGLSNQIAYVLHLLPVSGTMTCSMHT